MNHIHTSQKNHTAIHIISLLFMDAGNDPSEFGSKFAQKGGIYASWNSMWTPFGQKPILWTPFGHSFASESQKLVRSMFTWFSCASHAWI